VHRCVAEALHLIGVAVAVGVAECHDAAGLMTLIEDANYHVAVVANCQVARGADAVGEDDGAEAWREFDRGIAAAGGGGRRGVMAAAGGGQD